MGRDQERNKRIRRVGEEKSEIREILKRYHQKLTKRKE